MTHPIPPREGVPSSDTKFGNIPDEWIVVWCEGCGASITVDDDAGASYGEGWLATYHWSVVDCHGNNEVCPAIITEEPVPGYGYARSEESYDWEDVRIVLGYDDGKPFSRVYVNGELKSVRRVSVENFGGG